MLLTAFAFYSSFQARAGDEGRCTADELALSLSPTVSKTREILEQRWSRLSQQQRARWIVEARNKIRYKLGELHKRPYPSTVLGGDAETPFSAYAYAKSAFGELSEEQAKLIDPQKVHQQLIGLLNSVENFGPEVKAYENETATWAAQDAWITDMLKQKDLKTYGIHSKLPVVVEDQKNPTGWRLDWKDDYAGYRSGLVAQRDQLRKLVHQRLYPRTIGGMNVVPEDDRYFQQAYRLKTLEIYFHEIERQKILHPGKDLPPDVKEVHERIRKLYTPDLSKFRDDVRPPHWAWEKLNWEWFWGELKGLALKDLPAIEKKWNSNELIKFSKTLSASDLESIVGVNMSTSLSTFSRTKPVGFVIGLGGVSGTAELGKLAFDTLFYDRLHRQACASEPDDQAAAKKINDYFEARFYGHELWKGDQLVYPPAVTELNRIIELRKKIFGNNAHVDALVKLIKPAGAANTLSTTSTTGASAKPNP